MIKYKNIIRIIYLVLIAVLIIGVFSCKSRKITKSKEGSDIELIKKEKITHSDLSVKVNDEKLERVKLEAETEEWFMEISGESEIMPDGTIKTGVHSNARLFKKKETLLNENEKIVAKDSLSNNIIKESEVITDSTAVTDRSNKNLESEPNMPIGLQVLLIALCCVAVVGISVWLKFL